VEMNVFDWPAIMMILPGDDILIGRRYYVIANHLDESLWLTNEKSGEVVKSYFTTLFSGRCMTVLCLLPASTKLAKLLGRIDMFCLFFIWWRVWVKMLSQETQDPSASVDYSLTLAKHRVQVNYKEWSSPLQVSKLACD
jgi:hypothetical protein